MYNGHWFGRWHNKIARATGDVLTTVEVGHAPTHTVTNPNEASPHFERLTLPLSADNIFLELQDTAFGGLQKIIDTTEPAQAGTTHTVSGSRPMDASTCSRTSSRASAHKCAPAGPGR